MKMNVLILVAIFLLGSCTESPLEMEQEDEIFSDTRSGISPIDEALANLKTTRLGGPLLKALWQAYRVSAVMWEMDSTLPATLSRMGWVLYNPNNLQNGDLEQLAFHELFHIYKDGNDVNRVLNDEIEAYMAQYIFCLSVGRPEIFKTSNDELTENIIKLVKCMDLDSGTITSDEFASHYDKAMRAIKQCSLYQNKEGEAPWVEYPIRDISTLCNFLRSIK